jgi:DUF4097 and DUF4098 domain-containing protein YvlB
MAQEKWLVDGPRVIDLGLIRTLKVSLVAGQVDIVGHDEPGARVEVHSVSGKDLKVSVDGDTLEIDHPELRWDNFLDAFRTFKSNASADVSIMVPRDVAVKFGVVSASALVSGLRTDANISTASGDVVLDGLTGELRLNSVSGEISVRDHTGPIFAHTVNGAITATGLVSEFVTDSVTGDVFLDLAGTPSAIRINTVSGSVTVRLESDVPAEYKINSVSGRLHLDDTDIRSVRGAFSGKYGVLDTSWLDFRANTVSGDISLIHAVTA